LEGNGRGCGQVVAVLGRWEELRDSVVVLDSWLGWCGGVVRVWFRLVLVLTGERLALRRRALQKVLLAVVSGSKENMAGVD